MATPEIIVEKPELLLYEKSASGTLELVAIEYFRQADQGVPPTVLGESFLGPMAGHYGTMPTHYDMHVWLWKKNPAGLFFPWNRNVRCF